MSDATSEADAFPQLRAALDGEHELDYRDEQIVRLRFGLGNDGLFHSHDEIGWMFGVSRERIRQLERATLAKLGLSELRSPAPSRLSDEEWENRPQIVLPPQP